MAKLNGVKTIDMVNGEITKVAYDGAEYALTTEKAIKGDLLLALESCSDVEKEAFYPCEYGNKLFVNFCDNDDYERTRSQQDYKAYRKVSTDSPTLEERVTTLESEVSALKGEAEPPYEPKVGDIVAVTDIVGSNNVQRGDIGVVRELSESDGTVRVNPPGKVDKDNWLMAHKIRPATAEELAAYEKAQAPKFAVGDYVKVVKSELGNEGKIVQITDDSEGLQMRKANDEIVDADYLGVPVGDTDTYGFAADQLVKATVEEVAAASKPKLKAGDFVKIVDGDAYFTDKAYEVFADEDGDLYVFDDDGDERYSVLDDEAYELVDADTAKWAKLGRRVGEFKKGDIVRVIKDVCAKPVGTLFEVKRGGITAINCDEGYAYQTSQHIELIAPVESVLA